MSSKFRTVALIGKFPNAQGGTPADVLRDIAQTLESQNCQVMLDEMTAQVSALSDWPVRSLEHIGQHADLAVVVGGDGTMLATARQLARFDIPLIGINQGRLGFITDVPLAEQAQVLPAMLRGEYTEERRTMLAVRVEREGQLIFQTTAMNEVVVNRGSRAGLLELRAEIDGHFVANYRGDGLIVATPTGSTAYALSAGGPMMHPSTPAWVIAPIAPHMLSNRPIVIPDSGEVMLQVIGGRDASANFDMQSLPTILHGDRIYVRRSEHSVRFLHPRGWNYFATLRKKLGWNERSYRP